MSFRIVDIEVDGGTVTADITGPVTITPEPGSSFDIGTVAGTVDIAGPVTITDIVTANVIPKVSYIGEFSAASGILDVSTFNTLIIRTQLLNDTYDTSKYGYIGVQASHSVADVALPEQFYFLQGSAFNNNTGTPGDATETVVPLHGMDQASINPVVIGSGQSMIVDVFGSTETLPEFHRTSNFAPVAHILSSNQDHVLPAGGSTFPVPISSRPVRIYAHPRNTNTGASQAVQLTDTVTGALIANWTVPRGNSVGQEGQTNPQTPWFTMPHTLSPMTLFTGSATAGDLFDLLITDDV